MAHPAELQRRPAIRDLYIAINTTRGPLRDVRVRRALNMAHRRGHPAPHRDGGSRRPGRRRHPAGHRGVRLDPRAVSLGSRGRPAAAGRGGLRQRVHAPALAQQARRARAHGAVGAAGPRAARHPGGDRRARRAQRPRHRPERRGRPLPRRLVRRLPRSRELHLSALPLEEQGPRRQLRLPGGPGARRDDRPGAQHARRSGEGAARPRRSTRGCSTLAPWIFLWFPVDIWAVQPDVKGWRIPAVFTGQRWTDGRSATR